MSNDWVADGADSTLSEPISFLCASVETLSVPRAIFAVLCSSDCVCGRAPRSVPYHIQARRFGCPRQSSSPLFRDRSFAVSSSVGLVCRLVCVLVVNLVCFCVPCCALSGVVCGRSTTGRGFAGSRVLCFWIIASTREQQTLSPYVCVVLLDHRKHV